jgi:hypothetical protein
MRLQYITNNLQILACDTYLRLQLDQEPVVRLDAFIRDQKRTWVGDGFGHGVAEAQAQRSKDVQRRQRLLQQCHSQHHSRVQWLAELATGTVEYATYPPVHDVANEIVNAFALNAQAR